MLFIKNNDSAFDVVLFDLPGTLNAEGMIYTLSSIDHLFIPMKADNVVMESTLTFAKMLSERLILNSSTTTTDLHLFWTMIDKRERTPLYDQYENVINILGLKVMETHIPARSKFSKEIYLGAEAAYRSTLFAPDRSFVRDCMIDELVKEICGIIKL